MPAPQRKANWRAMPNAADYAASDERMNQLLKIAFLKRKPLAEEVRSFRADIAAAVKAYVIAAHQDRGPTKGQILAALTDLQKAASNFDRMVRSMDDATFEALLQQDGTIAEMSCHRWKTLFDRSSLEAKFSAAKPLISETKLAARWLERNAAPPKDKDLKLHAWTRNPFIKGPRTFDEFIAQLGEIYQRYSGNYPFVSPQSRSRPYLGIFLDFVMVALPPNERSRSKLAVGRTIQNVFPRPRRGEILRKSPSKKLP